MSQPVPPRRRIDALTGIRFFAAAMVLLYHFGFSHMAAAHAPAPLVNLLANGWLGVSLFFILSGYVIAFSYTDRVHGWRDYRSFLTVRFARLYPVYLLALAAALPFRWHLLTAKRIVFTLLMVQSWSIPVGLGREWLLPAWTLSVELFFYVCTPPVLALARRCDARASLAAAFACAALIVWVEGPLLAGHAAAHLGWTAHIPGMARRLVEFVYGAMLMRLVSHARPRLARWAGDIPTLTVAGGIVGVLMATRETLPLMVAVVAVGALFVQLDCGDSLLRRFLASPLLVLLGGASYSMYMLQVPIRQVLWRIAPGDLGRWLNLPAAIMISVAVFVLVEEPARRAFTGRRRARSTTPPFLTQTA